MEYGIFSWSNIHSLVSLKKSFYKAFGPLTRCKSSVDQEEWPCTKKMNVLICNICPKRAFFWENKLNFDYCLVFIFSSPKTISLKFITTTFLCHGPLVFFPLLEHLFCLSHRKTCWTMLVDDCRHQKLSLGDLELHGHWHFYLGVNQSGPGTSSTPITWNTWPWDNYLVHRVNNPQARGAINNKVGHLFPPRYDLGIIFKVRV